MIVFAVNRPMCFSSRIRRICPACLWTILKIKQNWILSVYMRTRFPALHCSTCFGANCLGETCNKRLFISLEKKNNIPADYKRNSIFRRLKYLNFFFVYTKEAELVNSNVQTHKTFLVTSVCVCSVWNCDTQTHITFHQFLCL